MVFAVFFYGVAVCFFLSASSARHDPTTVVQLLTQSRFHVLANHSPRVAAIGNQLDYLGVVLLMWGATIPTIFYGFYGDTLLQTLYCVGVCPPTRRTTPWLTGPVGVAARRHLLRGHVPSQISNTGFPSLSSDDVRFPGVVRRRVHPACSGQIWIAGGQPAYEPGLDGLDGVSQCHWCCCLCCEGKASMMASMAHVLTRARFRNGSCLKLSMSSAPAIRFSTSW